MRRPQAARPAAVGRRGQALAEFALVIPVFLLMIVAVFDVGRLVFAHNDITNAARSGARVAIVNQTAGVPETAVINQATSLGLVPTDVTVTYLTADLSGAECKPLAVNCIAQIVTTFEWQAITPIIGNIIGPVTVTTQARMPIERVYP